MKRNLVYFPRDDQNSESTNNGVGWDIQNTFSRSKPIFKSNLGKTIASL